MQVNHYINILTMECEREINLINDLLDLQQLEAEGHEFPTQAIDLNLWLTRLAEPFHSRVQQQQQQLILNPQPKLDLFESHLGCLNRIMAELLNNACKYTPAEGEIRVDLQQHNDVLRIQVTNTGVEISPSELGRIFEKFYRVPSSDPWGQPGTGLGLALIQELVHRLGGQIRVVSRQCKTCFTVELPWAKSGVSPEAEHSLVA
jgi:signal transduction histidine kinase